MLLATRAADTIALHAQALAKRAVEAQPAELRDELAKQERICDAVVHLRSLSEAMRNGSEQLFVDHVSWARTLLSARDVPGEHLTTYLTALQAVLKDELPHDGNTIDSFMNAAFERLAGPSTELTSYVEPGSLAARYLERLLKYDRNGALGLIHEAIASGTSIRDVYLQVVQKVQHEIGRLWQLNQLAGGQEHYCTAVSQLALAKLYPYIMHASGSGPTMVAACAAGERHEMGARMVADFFEMDGWNTTYLGADTLLDDVLLVMRSRRASLLAVSATLTQHVGAVSKLIDCIRSAPDLAHVKIMVGGRPFLVAGELWRRLGADACAQDAEAAVQEGRSLLSGPPS